MSYSGNNNYYEAKQEETEQEQEVEVVKSNVNQSSDIDNPSVVVQKASDISIQCSSEKNDSAISNLDDYTSKNGAKTNEPFGKQILNVVKEGINLEFFLFVLNMVKNIIGSGLLILPQAISRASIGLGLVIIVFACFACTYSFVTIAKACDLSKASSYSQIFNNIFGSKTAVFVDLIIIILNFGTNVSYIIIARNSLTSLFEDWFGIKAWSWLVVIILSTFILFPISSFPELHSIRHVSFIGILCLLWMPIAAIILFVNNPNVRGNISSKPADNWLVLFSAIPIISGIYDCHTNAPEFYCEFKKKRLGTHSLGRFSFAVFLAMLIVMIFNTLFGVIAYLQFGSSAEDDVLNSYNNLTKGSYHSKNIVYTMKLFAVVSVTISFTLFFNSLRSSIDHFVVMGIKKWSSCDNWFIVHSTVLRVLETAIIVALATVLGIFIESVGDFMACLQSICGSLTIYILPVIAVSKLQYRKAKQFTQFNQSVLLIYGFVVSMIIGFITSILFWIGHIKFSIDN